MAFPQGVDFRSTAGFVTDPANFTVDAGTTVYPTASPQGNNIGWVSTSGLSSRNRSASVDPRLAGMVFGTNIASTFKIDLPSAGTYNIRIRPAARQSFRSAPSGRIDNAAYPAGASPSPQSAGMGYRNPPSGCRLA